jgi:hypothetical protein
LFCVCAVVSGFVGAAGGASAVAAADGGCLAGQVRQIDKIDKILIGQQGQHCIAVLFV